MTNPLFALNYLTDQFNFHFGSVKTRNIAEMVKECNGYGPEDVKAAVDSLVEFFEKGKPERTLEGGQLTLYLALRRLIENS